MLLTSTCSDISLCTVRTSLTVTCYTISLCTSRTILTVTCSVISLFQARILVKATTILSAQLCDLHKVCIIYHYLQTANINHHRDVITVSVYIDLSNLQAPARQRAVARRGPAVSGSYCREALSPTHCLHHTPRPQLLTLSAVATGCPSPSSAASAK